MCFGKVAIGMALILGTAACMGDPEVSAPVGPTDKADILASVQVTPRANILAVGATQQITATAMTLAGTPLSAPEFTYSVGDTNTLQISPTGVVTARAMTLSPTAVIATLQHHSVTRADTTYVQVTPAVTPVAHLKLEVPQHLAAGEYVFLSATLTGPTNDTVYGMYFRVETRDPSAARVFPTFPYLSPNRTGDLWLFASVNAYGVSLIDSVKVPVVPPSMQTVQLSNDYSDPKRITSNFDGYRLFLSAGGMVTFTNYASSAIQITLTAPDGSKTSFLLNTNGNEYQFLSTPGTYKWMTNTKPVLSGTIAVE